MYKIMIAGAGKIGSLIAFLFADSGDYEVHIADLDLHQKEIIHAVSSIPAIQTVQLDAYDQQSMHSYLVTHQISAVISCLPYYLNVHVAILAKKAGVHYFDLTEDTDITEAIKSIAQGTKTAFVPQCGLAPGFIGIIANSLMQEFDECLHAKLRVGALPQRASNILHYSLTWSTDGLINQYGNPCFGIEVGKMTTLMPLEGLESIEIDGCEYEAFNTSGGLGGLTLACVGKIQSLNYKTIRYPGHCEKMRFLMKDLKLNEDRETLKYILERSIPKTYQDLVIIYVVVEGMIDGQLIEKNYLKKLYPKNIRGIEWSAIQVSTSCGLCMIVDLMLTRAQEYSGFISPEYFKLTDVLANRFGQYFLEDRDGSFSSVAN